MGDHPAAYIVHSEDALHIDVIADVSRFPPFQTIENQDHLNVLRNMLSTLFNNVKRSSCSNDEEWVLQRRKLFKVLPGTNE